MHPVIAIVIVLAFALALSPTLLVFATRNRHQLQQTLLTIWLICATAFLLGVVWVFDEWFAFTNNLLFCVGVAVLPLAMGIALYCFTRRKCDAWLAVLFASIVVSLHWVDLSPVKPYHRFFDRIQRGMTASEVITHLNEEFPSTGRFNAPVLRHFPERPADLNFFLDPNDQAYNAEGVFVRMRDGKVISKVYSAD